MRSSKFLLFSAFIILLVLFVTCDDESIDPDHYPPSEVHGLTISQGEAEVFLSWEDPRNYDFSNVIVECGKRTFKVNRGIGELQIDSLTNDSLYKIRVKTQDFSGNKSPGTLIIGKPKSPPILVWNYPAEVEIQYSPQGYPNGTFTLKRNFTNVGNPGYISFQIYAIDLVNNDTIDSSAKILLLEGNTSYTFYFEANGDLSAFNCTECNTNEINNRVVFISELDQETFFADLISCQIISDCSNGINKRKIRWNSIKVRDVYLEKITEK